MFTLTMFHEIVERESFVIEINKYRTSLYKFPINKQI